MVTYRRWDSWEENENCYFIKLLHLDHENILCIQKIQSGQQKDHNNSDKIIILDALKHNS